MKYQVNVCNRLRAVSLFSVVRRAKRETREWPRARLMARDGRGRPRFARLAASPLARACALPLLNRKKKRDCSQSTFAKNYIYYDKQNITWLLGDTRQHLKKFHISLRPCNTRYMPIYSCIII